MWHDTDQGRLVRLACRPASVHTVGTLSTLNMNDPTAGPMTLTAINDACGVEASAALVAWGDWGVLLETLPDGDGRTAEILLDSDGDEIVRSDRDPDTRFVGGGRTWDHHVDPRARRVFSIVESRLAMNLRSAGVNDRSCESSTLRPELSAGRSPDRRRSWLASHGRRTAASSSVGCGMTNAQRGKRSSSTMLPPTGGSSFRSRPRSRASSCHARLPTERFPPGIDPTTDGSSLRCRGS